MVLNTIQASIADYSQYIVYRAIIMIASRCLFANFDLFLKLLKSQPLIDYKDMIIFCEIGYT